MIETIMLKNDITDNIATFLLIFSRYCCCIFKWLVSSSTLQRLLQLEKKRLLCICFDKGISLRNILDN